MLVTIKRQNSPDTRPYNQSFRYDGSKNITVAALLDYLNYNDDLTDIEGKRCRLIDWECSCMQKACGACAMVINGKPALACSVFLADVASDTIRLEPLSVFPIARDLRVRRDVIFSALKEMQLWVTEFKQPEAAELEGQYNSAKCLKCGLCLEVCPNYGCESLTFAGPAVVNETYLSYTQNANPEQRKQILKAYRKRFSSGCSKALSCMKICPVNMQPLVSIGYMNKQTK